MHLQLVDNFWQWYDSFVICSFWPWHKNCTILFVILHDKSHVLREVTILIGLGLRLLFALWKWRGLGLRLE
jgi:hypothetical protein